MLYTIVSRRQSVSWLQSTARSMCRLRLFSAKVVSFGEAAQGQALAIPEVIFPFIIHPLLTFSNAIASQSAFLITPTEVMLFFPVLPLYVHKCRCLMLGICTRASPSMDSILFPSRLSQMRAVKWMWAMSCTTVTL